jgi:signal transduction histidine kinase
MGQRPGHCSPELEKLNMLIRGALAEMRSLLFELRSGEMQNQTLNQLLSTLAEAGRARTRATILISFSGEGALPEKVKLIFNRIAQEALNNAMNHAEESLTEITLMLEPDYVAFRIRDDGLGFYPREIPAGHLGINIMYERAAQIETDLQIQSTPVQGIIFSVTWPKHGG